MVTSFRMFKNLYYSTMGKVSQIIINPLPADRERLKLSRDELFEYVKRGFVDDEDSVDELSIFDRNRLAAEMVRINEYLSATSNKKTMVSVEVDKLLHERRMILIKQEGMLQISPDYSSGSVYKRLRKKLQGINSELFALTGRRY